MRTKKNIVPKFKSEKKEAEYWDTHSPLDFVPEPEAQRVQVRGIKDRPITIRLDSESRLKLSKLASERGVGPSTFARLILMSAIKQEDRSLIKEQPIDSDIGQNILSAKVKLQEAQSQALEGDWGNAISLLNEVAVEIPEEYRVYVDGEMRMVWSAVQKVSMKPLLVKAEKSIDNWDYEEAYGALDSICAICALANLPVNSFDLFMKIVRVAQATSAAAASWKSDVDTKLTRVMANIFTMKDTLEQRMDVRFTQMEL